MKFSQSHLARTGFLLAACGQVCLLVLVAFYAHRAAYAEGRGPDLGHVAVAVRDLNKAVEWYRDTLGFQLVNRVTIDADTSPQGVVGRHLFGPDLKILDIAQMRSANSVGLELFHFVDPAFDPRRAQADPRVGILHVGIIVSDVEPVLSRVLRNGGKFVCRGAPNPKRHIVFCQDPDGNVLEIATGPWDGM